MKKIIIISGGSDGLGKETAIRLSSKYSVVILSANKSKLEKVAKEISVDFEVCDVADFNNVNKTIENVIAKFKKIDCVINNAGLWVEGELDNNDPKRIKEVLEVNTLGTINLSKAVIPVMKKQKSGLIINVISQAGISAKAERVAYNTSKWAITGFTKSLQLELGKYGIGVTGIYPGKMKTKMFEKMGIVKDMKDGVDPKEVAKTIEFILSFNNTTLFPEIGIKHLHN